METKTLRRPVIGITCCFNDTANYYHLARDYVSSVLAPGGVPLILPHYHEVKGTGYLQAIDGLLLTGGGDVDSYHFGQEPRPGLGAIDPDRDTFELALTAGALESGMPVLGICRGMQVLNLAAGGTVCQDLTQIIDRPYKHMQQAPRWYATHGIKIEKNSLLGEILNADSYRVNSFHHQVVDQIAPNLKVVATTGDGAVEAIESAEQDLFVLGVQFHPENMWARQPRVLELFVAYVQACARYLSIKNKAIKAGKQ